jgi:NMD protein affecting ribosome stability and mRNA decay
MAKVKKKKHDGLCYRCGKRPPKWYVFTVYQLCDACMEKIEREMPTAKQGVVDISKWVNLP